MNSPRTSEAQPIPSQQRIGLAGLMRLSLQGADLRPLCQSLIERATKDPHDAASLLDVSVIFQLFGNQELARAQQLEALKTCRHYRLPARRPVRLRLLALMAPGDLMANVPVECLLEDSDVELSLYYAMGDALDPAVLPEHDVLFVAISETEANRPVLAACLPALARWPKPVLNNPLHIRRVARDTAARLLSGLPGVVMPANLRVHRHSVRQVASGAADSRTLFDMDFPLIVRPVDSHAGHDLHKVDNPAALAAVLDDIPGDELFVAPFVDYRGADGQFRKYRVILIDGKPYACHMGISSHWMIHYLNAGMAESADKRAEEAAFMARFDGDFAVRHAAALRIIDDSIGLDYLGIDCAETADGKLLVFEVDHAMVVHAMDPVDLYPYKQGAMRTLFDAFRAMLFKAAGRPDCQ